jgi:hypothetical protein
MRTITLSFFKSNFCINSTLSSSRIISSYLQPFYLIVTSLIVKVYSESFMYTNTLSANANSTNPAKNTGKNV